MNKTSIIVPAYDTIRLQRNITSACLGNIARYTNRNEYELIFIDQEPIGKLNEKFHFIDIDKFIKLEKHIGSSASMNLGAEKSSPDTEYLCFLHNDVFVWEGWLETLRGFLDREEAKIIMPHQGAYDREAIKQFYEKENPRGNDDAGLVMMSKDTFKKIGGWDERFPSIYMDSAFRNRFPYKFWCTGKCIITHITSGTLYAWSEEDEQKAYDNEGELFNSIYEKK